MRKEGKEGIEESGKERGGEGGRGKGEEGMRRGYLVERVSKLLNLE